MNKNFLFKELSLSGAYLITPFVNKDNRGAFIKDYSFDMFKKNGIEHELKEVFYTVSKKGVIRGLHFQVIKQQPKLVRCISGKIYDVIVDLRKDSPTYKKWLGFYLSGENYNELLVPSGFAHGYLVLEDSIVSYKCSENFYSEYDSGIKWNDSELNISWPIDEVGGIENIILSDKDTWLQTMKDFEQEGIL